MLQTEPKVQSELKMSLLNDARDYSCHSYRSKYKHSYRIRPGICLLNLLINVEIESNTGCFETRVQILNGSQNLTNN